MRYELFDTEMAIREVQTFLHFIRDKKHNEITRVAIDGIFGKETEDAVREFQRIYGLYESGVVDRETFELLNKIYLELLLEYNASEFVITSEGFPLSLGSQNNDVLVLNIMLIELGKNYSDIGDVRKSNYYSTETENAVTNLQKIFRIEENGIVDALFYDRLRDELIFIQLLETEYD